MKYFLSIIIILLSFSVSSADRHVRPTAGGPYGDNDGTTYDNAWSGLPNIDDTELSPGDTLYIDGTFASNENAYSNWTTSGTDGNQITITAYDTADPPVFDGKVSIGGVGSWTAGTTAHWVSIGFRIYIVYEKNGDVYTALDEADESGGTCDYDFTAQGNFCYDAGQLRLYYIPTDGTFSDETVYRARTFLIDFAENVDHINISYITASDYYKGFLFDGHATTSTGDLDDLNFDNLTFTRMRIGIHLFSGYNTSGATHYGVDTATLTNSTFDYCGFAFFISPRTSPAPNGQSSNVTITGNAFTNAGWSNSVAQAINGTNQEWHETTRYGAVGNGYGDQEQVTLFNVQTVTVSRNTFGSGASRGLLFDCQGTANIQAIRVYDNLFTELAYSGLHFTGATAGTGDYEDIQVYRNRFFDVGGGGEGYYGTEQRAAIYVGNVGRRAGDYSTTDQPLLIINNTITDSNRGLMLYGHSVDNVDFKNNIVKDSYHSHVSQLATTITEQTGIDIETNLYYPTDGGCNSTDCFMQGSVENTKRSWSYWTSTSPTHDTTSPTPADPIFDGDYHIGQESPAYNTGDNDAALYNSYGGTIDIGFFEYGVPTSTGTTMN